MQRKNSLLFLLAIILVVVIFIVSCSPAETSITSAMPAQTLALTDVEALITDIGTTLFNTYQIAANIDLSMETNICTVTLYNADQAIERDISATIAKILADRFYSQMELRFLHVQENAQDIAVEFQQNTNYADVISERIEHLAETLTGKSVNEVRFLDGTCIITLSSDPSIQMQSDLRNAVWEAIPDTFKEEYSMESSDCIQLFSE